MIKTVMREVRRVIKYFMLQEVKMEVVRKYIDANSLMTVMKLPEKFRNRKLEVIILPAEEQEKLSKKAADIDQALQSLVGAIPYTDMSLEELREERLKKYENID